MADFTSTNNKVRSGDIDITLSGFDGTDTTFNVFGVGDLHFEFEITENESAKDSISQILGNVTLSLDDNLGDGTSFINRFYDASSTITAKIEHTDNSSVLNTYNFVVLDEEIRRGELDRKVDIRLQVDTDISYDISDYFAGNMNYGAPPSNAQLPYEDISSSTTVTCAALGDFIKAVIREFNTDNTETFNSDDFVEVLPSTSGEDGDEEYVMVSGACADNSQLVIDELMRIAIAEGALFGTGLGQNFWCYRLFTGDSVELTDDDVEDFESILAFNEYKEIKTSFTGSACFTFQTINTENITPFKSQQPSTFDLTTDFKATSLGNYVHADSKMDTNVTSKDGSTLANGQASAYRTSLTTTRSAAKGFRCLATVLGFKTVKPWQTVTFDTSFPSVYQSGEYRIATADYSWESDKIELELYRIS